MSERASGTRAERVMGELEALISAHTKLRQDTINEFLLRWFKTREPEIRAELISLLEPIKAPRRPL